MSSIQYPVSLLDQKWHPFLTCWKNFISLATEQLVHTKLDDHATCVSKVTKEMMEILAALETQDKQQFIMIEVHQALENLFYYVK